MKVSRSSLAFASLGLLALAGCPVTGDDLCAKGTCDSAIDATTPPPSDAGADAIVELPRDPCVDKPTSPECLTNDSALFVSASADAATADGSILHPYKTITAAVNKVTNERRRIYVCDGTYPEQVALETLPMTLIGGVTCDFRGPGPKPKIAPPSGIALSIAAVGGTSVIDVIVEGASNANTKGDSAIAMFVTRAKNVLLRGVEATALDGQPGKEGTPFVENWSGTPQVPTNANGGVGAPPPACGKCKDGTTFSFAGAGGSSPGATGGYNPEAGAAMPMVGSDNAGNNGSSSCFVGKPGAAGEPLPSAAGATRPGIVQPSAWNTDPTAKAGGIGGPGQGGGGGGSTTALGGGSGGCGGCGGSGGGAGGNGGSSIALLVYESEITIAASTFKAGSGGKGGDGAAGQEGQTGISGGAGACGGGTGGFGAGGGGGGGGAGGYSAAIAYQSATIPQHDDKTTLTKGTGGPIGKGGLPGTSTGKPGNPGLDGAEGLSGEILDIK